LEHQKSINQNKKFLKKTVFRTLKVERGQKFVWGLPKELAGSTQNPKKNIRTSNQPIKTKIFPKKVCLVPKKCKGAKNSYGGYPTEFAGSTQNPKKISEHQINQSIRKFSQKKYV
jgi:hypothetical protein